MRVLVTAALPYVNNEPHLGNLIGSVLSADVYARYLREFTDDEVVFLCGTDEYGSTTEVKARQENSSCEEICARYRKLHREIYDYFEIEFDVWGRTSTDAQTELTQEILEKLRSNGLIEADRSDQFYDPKAKMFIPDRLVEGLCYHSDCIDRRAVATGDQCDLCGQLVDPTRLLEPTSKLTGVTPERRSTEHYYFDLERLHDRVAYWSERVTMTSTARGITSALLRKPFHRRSITRDLSWGTPLPPSDRLFGKVFYVWFDAPIGYRSMLRVAGVDDRFDQWIQFMAKDNVPFHTLFFPATLIGAGLEEWLPTQIAAIEYLNYEGTKFSKSRGVGIFGSEVREWNRRLEIDSDYWRSYLISIRPESSDSNFEWNGFAAHVSGTLVKNFGNFVHRVFSLARKFELPDRVETGAEMQLVDHLHQLKDKYRELFAATKLREAQSVVFELSSFGNRYLQNETPWKQPRDQAVRLIGQAMLIVDLLIRMIGPFCPIRARRIREWLPECRITAESITVRRAGTPIPLFRELDLRIVEV